MGIDLKPCPFCGEDCAKIRKNSIGRYVVYCEWCTLSIGEGCDAIEVARYKWNTRHEAAKEAEQPDELLQNIRTIRNVAGDIEHGSFFDNGILKIRGNIAGIVTRACDRLEAAMLPKRESGCQKCDEEMLRVKMCEHIAEGEEGWQQHRNLCPSTMAVATLRDEVERLEKLVNTPELLDFIKAVPVEAVHQRERWGEEHDKQKEAPDWFWLVGYVAGKALSAWKTGDTDKLRHHVITTAAVCANWHASLSKIEDQETK